MSPPDATPWPPGSRLDQAIAREIAGARRQFNRYAYDFMVIDSAGALNRNGGATLADWLQATAPSSCPLPPVWCGSPRTTCPTTRSAVSPPDNAAGTDLARLAGNYIVIDHENGECTLLGHLKRGSQSVSGG